MQANLVKAVYPSVYSQQICQWVLTDLMVHMHHSFCPPQQESADFWSNTRSQDNRLSHISLCGGTTQLHTCSRTHFHEHPKYFIRSVLSSTNFNYLSQKEAYLSFLQNLWSRLFTSFHWVSYLPFIFQTLYHTVHEIQASKHSWGQWCFFFHCNKAWTLNTFSFPPWSKSDLVPSLSQLLKKTQLKDYLWGFPHK